MAEEQTNNNIPELTHTNSAFEVVEKDDIDMDHNHNNESNVDNNLTDNQLNISNLSAIAPNALFNSFPKEYIETLIKKLNERSNDDEEHHINDTDHSDQSNHSINSNSHSHSSMSMSKLKNIGGTLAQQLPQLPSLFDTAQLTAIMAQFNKQQQQQQQQQLHHLERNHPAEHEEDTNIEDEENKENEENINEDKGKEEVTKMENMENMENVEENEEDGDEDDDDDDDEYEYEYYHTKMSHDIEWNTEPNDELFIISKDLFDIEDDNEFYNEMNVKYDKSNKNDHNKKEKKNKKSNIKNKFKIKNKNKIKEEEEQSQIEQEEEEEKKEDNNNNHNHNNGNKSGFSLWTESLNSMLTHAKHKMYTMLANPSLKWDSRNNRHLFSLSHDVYIMGNHYEFSKTNDISYNKDIMQSIVLDIYSKIWITYRSKFENILSSRYTSDAGWGCMLRTTQMMTAQALIIFYFDYSWRLTKLNHNKEDIHIYYNQILSLFNDSMSMESPLSLHNMIKYGSLLYDKPVGHWYGPMQTCIMISKCIQNYHILNDQIECIISDSGIIYKSDISLKKYALIFLPLRLGLDSLNINYIPSIKQCFHLKECIGIIGGKPQKSLYFIGYQNDNLFYLDPHTVFPTPNIHKPLSKQKCVFHCQDINSLFAKQLDPSMAIAFFIKPNENDLNSFWKNASKLMNHQYSIFSLADQRPNYERDLFDIDDNNDDNNNNDHDDDDNDSNFDNEWEKI